jgi:TP901 family phage tail tape measure protein
MADYSIDAEITADSSKFSSAINTAIETLSGFTKDISDLGGKISEGCKEWGIDFSKFYSKGSDTLKKFGVDIDKFASKLGMSGPMLAAITTATIAMTKFGQEMNGAFSEIAKGTGASGEALEELKETARQALMGGVGSDVATVAGMVADLNTRFGVTGEEAAALTNKFDAFSDVMGVDAREAINSAADVMAKWNIDVEDTDILLDQLTKASQDSGASVSTLMGGLKKGQAVFSQFGMSATQSIAYMGQLAKAGIDTDTALTGMRTALTNFASEGKNAEEAMKETAEAIKNAGSETEALQIATEVFGNRAGPEMVQVFKNGADSIDEFTKNLTSAVGQLETTDELSRTSQDAMTELANSLKGAFLDFGGAFDDLFKDLLDSVAQFVNFLAPVITPIGEIFRDVFSGIGELLKTLAESFVAFQTKYNRVWQNITTTMNNVAKFFNRFMGIFLQIFKDVFGLIFAILDRDWEMAWLRTKRILLTATTGILDGLSFILNGFNSMINKIIDKLNFLIEKINDVGTFLGFSEIKAIDPLQNVDLSTATGLNAALAETDARIKALEQSKTGKELGGQLKAVADTGFEVADSMDDVATSAGKAQTAAVNLGKAVDMLKLDYEENLRYAESTKSTAEKQFDIKRKYLLAELEEFKDANEKERAEALKTAQTEKDIATINKNYDDQLAQHTIETTNKIADAEKELARQKGNLAKSNAEYAIEMFQLESESEIERLEKSGATAAQVNTKKREQLKKLFDLQMELNAIEENSELANAKTEEEVFQIKQKYALKETKLRRDTGKELEKITDEVAQVQKKTFADWGKEIANMAEKFAANIKKAFSAVAKFTVNLFKGIGRLLNTAIEFNPDKALDDLLVFEDKVLTFFVETLPQLPEFLASALQSVGVLLNNVLKSIDTSAIKDVMGSIIKTVMSLAPSLVDAVLGIARSAFNMIVDILPELIPQIGSFITNLIGKITKMLVDGLPKIAKTIPKLIKTLLKELPKIIKALANGLKALIPEIIKAIVEITPDIVKAIIETLPEIVSAILEVIPMLIVELIKAIPELGKALLNIFAQLGGWILSGLKIAFNAVGDFFKGIIDWFAEIGQKIADALSAPIRGIQSAFGAVGNFFGDVFGGIKNFFGFETGTLQAPRGLAIVGEAGPELVNFKGGEQVLNARNTQKALASTGKAGNTWNVTFNNLQDTSAYAMMNQLRQYNRELAINGLI